MRSAHYIVYYKSILNKTFSPLDQNAPWRWVTLPTKKKKKQRSSCQSRALTCDAAIATRKNSCVRIHRRNWRLQKENVTFTFSFIIQNSPVAVLRKQAHYDETLTAIYFLTVLGASWWFVMPQMAQFSNSMFMIGRGAGTLPSEIHSHKRPACRFTGRAPNAFTATPILTSAFTSVKHFFCHHFYAEWMKKCWWISNEHSKAEAVKNWGPAGDSEWFLVFAATKSPLNRGCRRLVRGTVTLLLIIDG